MPWGEHWLFIGFLDSDIGKLWLIIVRIQVVRSSTGHTDENVEKVRNIINKDQRSTISEIAGKLVQYVEYPSEF